MPTNYPWIKEKLLSLINKNQSTHTLKETDIDFESFVPSAVNATCSVTVKANENSRYYFDQSLTYKRLDISKVFFRIPVRVTVKNGSTVRNAVEVIAEKYGINFDLTRDFSKNELDQEIVFAHTGATNLTIRVSKNSLAWYGDLSVFVVDEEFIKTDGNYILKTNGGTIAFDFSGWENISIDWGDGNKETLGAGVVEASHTYADTNAYTVLATGTVTNKYKRHYIEGEHITEIIDWNNRMSSSPETKNLTALLTVPASIPFTWTELYHLFNGAKSLNDPNIQEWDLSRVTRAINVFNNCLKLNIDVSKWNVTRIYNMSNLFSSCVAFTGTGLDNWDVSNVSDMSSMFSNCEALDGEKLVNWKTDSLVDASYMFAGTTFNSDISGWNTTKLENVVCMFGYNTVFNIDLSGWNTQSLRKIDRMMYYNTAYNQDLSGWDVRNVISGKDNVGEGATNWPRERWPGYVKTGILGIGNEGVALS